MSFSNADWCELLGGIHSAGGRVSLVGAQLRVDGISLLSAQLVEQVRTHKSQLVKVLSRSVGLTCPSCGGGQVAVPTFDGFENFECFHCGQCSGCRRAQK